MNLFSDLSDGTIDDMLNQLPQVPAASVPAVEMTPPTIAIDHEENQYPQEEKESEQHLQLREMAKDLLEVWLNTKVRPEVEALLAVHESRRPERFWTVLFMLIIAGMRRFGKTDSDIYDVNLTIRGGRNHSGRIKEVRDHVCFIEDTSHLFLQHDRDINEESPDGVPLDIASAFDRLESQEREERERINQEARAGSIRQIALRSVLALRMITLQDHAQGLFREIETALSRKARVGGRYSPNSVAFQSTLGWILEVDRSDHHETVFSLELEGGITQSNVVVIDVNNYGLLVRDEQVKMHSLVPVDHTAKAKSDYPVDEATDSYHFIPWDCVVSIEYADSQRLEYIKKVAEQLMLQRAEEAKKKLEEGKKQEAAFLASLKRS